ncbi:hypothetical protein F8M41_004381 [Gigaspora margarita]|uniref:Uncharacterized protein n=1 Tax=Gigaspora margarita TaxID=4874 RepID=A0A8H3XAG6_GIGMA|nr:hypothetical protein F8M41_004381 [Gigaspora margarita]
MELPKTKYPNRFNCGKWLNDQNFAPLVDELSTALKVINKELSITTGPIPITELNPDSVNFVNIMATQINIIQNLTTPTDKTGPSITLNQLFLYADSSDSKSSNGNLFSNGVSSPSIYTIIMVILIILCCCGICYCKKFKSSITLISTASKNRRTPRTHRPPRAPRAPRTPKIPNTPTTTPSRLQPVGIVWAEV